MNLTLAWPVHEGSGLCFELSSCWCDFSLNAAQPPSDKSEQAAHPSRTLGFLNRKRKHVMEQQKQLRALQLQQLQQDIQEGLVSGELMPWNPEAIKAEGRRRLEARTVSTLSD